MTEKERMLIFVFKNTLRHKVKMYHVYFGFFDAVTIFPIPQTPTKGGKSYYVRFGKQRG